MDERGSEGKREGVRGRELEAGGEKGEMKRKRRLEGARGKQPRRRVWGKETGVSNDVWNLFVYRRLQPCI